LTLDSLPNYPNCMGRERRLGQPPSLSPLPKIKTHSVDHLVCYVLCHVPASDVKALTSFTQVTLILGFALSLLGLVL